MAGILLLLLIVIFNTILLSHSQTIINTLPGYPGQLPFELETGYVGVGEREDVQLFYYFVESLRSPKDDPLIIWLPGGPGCSALRGFFYGVGPVAFDYSKPIDGENLELNPSAWTKVANIIFLDAPAAGFSYVENPKTYKNSDTLSAKYTHHFLRKWLSSHPKFTSNPVYAVGLSYSGIIVPILVQDIHNGNEAGIEPPINIKGYILGNPLTDRNIDFNSRVVYAHRSALISDEIYESALTNCNGDYISENPINSLCARNLQVVDQCLDDLFIYNILEPICEPEAHALLKSDGGIKEKYGLKNLIKFPQYPEQWCRDKTYDYSRIWANRKDVQKALSIRKGTLQGIWESCNENDHYRLGKNDSITYTYDVPSSLAYHKNFTRQKFRALIHSGDLDMAFSYVGTRKWISSLNLSVKNTWAPWFFKNQVAGYTEVSSHGDYSLTFATVKGAGHAAQEYKPELCLAMVERWLSYKPL